MCEASRGPPNDNTPPGPQPQGSDIPSWSDPLKGRRDTGACADRCARPGSRKGELGALRHVATGLGPELWRLGRGVAGGSSTFVVPSLWGLRAHSCALGPSSESWS